VAAQNARDNIKALLERTSVRGLGLPHLHRGPEARLHRTFESLGMSRTPWKPRRKLAAKTIDFSTLVKQLVDEGRLTFKEGEDLGKITYHDSCHLKRTLKASGGPPGTPASRPATSSPRCTSATPAAAWPGPTPSSCPRSRPRSWSASFVLYILMRLDIASWRTHNRPVNSESHFHNFSQVPAVGAAGRRFTWRESIWQGAMRFTDVSAFLEILRNSP
jgi:hypothetical protein